MATLKQLKNKRIIKKKEFMEEWERAIDIATSQLEPSELVKYRRRLVKWWKNENLKCFLTSSERKSMWEDLTSLTYVSNPEINKLYKKEAAAHAAAHKKRTEKMNQEKRKVADLLELHKEKMSREESGLWKSIYAALGLLAGYMKKVWQGIKKYGARTAHILGIGFDYYHSGKLGLKGLDRYFYMTMSMVDEVFFVGGSALAHFGTGVGAAIAGKLLAAIGFLIAGYRIYTFVTGKPDYLDELAQIYVNFSDPKMLKKKTYENKCLPKASYKGSDGKLTKRIFIDQAYRLHQSRERLVNLNNETLNLIKEFKKKKKETRRKYAQAKKRIFAKGKKAKANVDDILIVLRKKQLN